MSRTNCYFFFLSKQDLQINFSPTKTVFTKGAPPQRQKCPKSDLFWEVPLFSIVVVKAKIVTIVIIIELICWVGTSSQVPQLYCIHHQSRGWGPCWLGDECPTAQTNIGWTGGGMGERGKWGGCQGGKEIQIGIGQPIKIFFPLCPLVK